MNTDLNDPDRRPEAGKAMTGRGRLIFPDKNVFVDCTILFASTSGANVRLHHRSGLPAQLYFLNVKQRTVHVTTIIREDTPYAELRFTQSHVLNAELPHELDFMRKHWIECARH